MDFTREPIIETVITPKEGYKLVIRNSKASGQDEFFVDAVEIVSFGKALFFRSIEKPKPFLLPTSDYEVLEVRETRMILKNVGVDRSIKIAGSREPAQRVQKEIVTEKIEPLPEEEETIEPGEVILPPPATQEARDKLDKKRDRRRPYRRRRGRNEELTSREEETVAEEGEEKGLALEPVLEPPEKKSSHAESGSSPAGRITSSLLASLIPPPANLISETIARYKENELYKGAFILKEGDENKQEEKEQEEGSQQEESEGAADAVEQAPGYVSEETLLEKFRSEPKGEPELSEESEASEEEPSPVSEEETAETSPESAEEGPSSYPVDDVLNSPFLFSSEGYYGYEQDVIARARLLEDGKSDEDFGSTSSSSQASSSVSEEQPTVESSENVQPVLSEEAESPYEGRAEEETLEKFGERSKKRTGNTQNEKTVPQNGSSWEEGSS